MKSTIYRLFNLFLILLGIACSFAAQANYMYTPIEPQGATLTQVWDINNSGKVIGTSDIEDSQAINFLYDSKKERFTLLTSLPGEGTPRLTGINESGVMVGVSDGVGLIFSKKNTSMSFSLDGYDFVQPRAIGPYGLVTGFAIKDGQNGSIGFIYDPDSNTYEEILPNNDPVGDIDVLAAPFTIAQGFNARGQVVGNVTLVEDIACSGCSSGTYGFLREVNGDITLFRVNEQNTWARGINDTGLITGFFEEEEAVYKGFVGSLSTEPGYQSLDDPEVLQAFGEDETYPQAINNQGLIVGESVNEDGEQRGFIATPITPGKNNK